MHKRLVLPRERCQSDAERKLCSPLAPLLNELPDVVVANNVNELAESLRPKYARPVIDSIRTNSDYLAVFGAGSSKKQVNFRLSFQSLDGFKSNNPN